jgi:hypothetical protein
MMAITLHGVELPDRSRKKKCGAAKSSDRPY